MSGGISRNRNSQSDGRNTLKRMIFEYDGTYYPLILNPEEYTQTEPNRATVTQTKGGAWADLFGSGVATLNMKGTTGLKNGSNNPVSGFDEFDIIRTLIRQVYDNVNPGEVVNPTMELKLHNFTDGEHWVVLPNTFTLRRSVSRTLLYCYDIQLTLLRPAFKPSDNEVKHLFVPRIQIY